MKSDAKTVKEYLAALPEERGAALRTVRDVILENLPEGYVETMDWGMISYQVPLDVIGAAVAATPRDRFIQRCEQARPPKAPGPKGARPRTERD